MKKIVRLTESDLTKLVRRIIKEVSGPLDNQNFKKWGETISGVIESYHNAQNDTYRRMGGNNNMNMGNQDWEHYGNESGAFRLQDSPALNDALRNWKRRDSTFQYLKDFITPADIETLKREGLI